MPNAQGQFVWADVKAQVAFRLNRPNLDPAYIQLMAEERADVLAADGFLPSEQTNTTITTQPGQYFYNLPRGVTRVLMVRLLLNNIWIPLTWAKRYEDILLSDPVQPPFTAIPSQARAYGRLLRLFPTPNAQYGLELSVDQNVMVPTDDNDSENYWVNEGRALMINAVCQHIAQELFRDPDRASNHAEAAQEAMDALTAITHVRNGPHIIEQH